MRARNAIVVLAIMALGVLAVGLVDPSFLRGLDDAPEGEGSRVSASESKRDFMFRIAGYKTENQGSQTRNKYFRYRYDAGIAEDDIPNNEDLRADVLEFVDNIDASEDPYWQTLNQELCTGVLSNYPIRATSCRLQVYPTSPASTPAFTP